jgi:glutathione S-transferase
MTDPVLYGADYSVYVRIARMALAEKGVPYRLEPVDVFAPDGLPDWYREKHPFGRIPAFEHGGMVLIETTAIARYVDEAFAGPALQPADAASRARMNEMIALLDSYAYRPMVWDIAVELLEQAQPDMAKVEQALPTARLVLSELEKRAAANDWLAGPSLTLADLHAAPIIGYFLRAPLAADMLAACPSLSAWWRRISERDSYRATASSS